MITKFNNFLNENKKDNFQYYLNQVNSTENWIPITDELYDIIEQEGWIEELTSDIDDDQYDKIRDDIKSKIVCKELELLDEDKEGLIDNDEQTIEFFNGFDMNLKETQEYPYHTIDFIDYDEGIVYIMKYNE